MATKIIKAQMMQRHDTRSNWESVNPVLLDGELGIVSDDPNLYKVGDGRTEWNNLPYRGFDGTLVQEQGTSANAAMSQKAVTEALAKKPGTTGTYPSMHVGTADDLAGRGESVPASFGFRASGGKSIKDGRAYIKRIKGNSVVWNQQCESLLDWEINGALSLSEDENEYTYNVLAGAGNPTKLRYRTLSGHKYMLSLEAKCSDVSQPIFICFAKADNTPIFSSSNFTETYAQYCVLMKDATDIVEAQIRTRNYAQGTTISIKKGSIQLIDLTQMFGAGNEPSTIEEFYARVATLGINPYAYNEGQVIHCNTESIKSVGDNAWDEEWEVGGINTETGQNENSSVNFRSKNYIRVLGGQAYYFTCNRKMDTYLYFYLHFYDHDKKWIGRSAAYASSSTMSPNYNNPNTIPFNAEYMRFVIPNTYGTAYKNDIMISLVHSGWKQDTDAGYQPYWQDILPLPIIRKYFPDGMKKAGSAHDEIRYNKTSGKWEYSKGKIKAVDMGTLNWNYTSGNISKFSCVMPSDARVFQENVLPNMMTSLYTAQKNSAGILRDKNIYRAGSYLGVLDSAYTDAASFKADMQGVILYYESNDWEWVELDAEDQNFRDYYQVADFGTEEAIPATDAEGNIIPSAAFSADIIYQFNAVDMIREHEIEITELQNVIATMQAQLTALTNGVATLQV